MKHILLGVLLLMGAASSIAQQTDTVPPYKKDKHIPAFKLLQTDSATWFSNKDIPKADFTIIVYFSPDCGHCQHEAKEMVENMPNLKNTFIVWASYRDMKDIKEFYHFYGLDKFDNVRVGRDPSYTIPAFFQVKFTPFVAVYDKKGLFLKAYETGVEMDELNELLGKE